MVQFAIYQSKLASSAFQRRVGATLLVLSSSKTQRENYISSKSYIYMNGCSGTMLWVDYIGHHGPVIYPDIPILGVSGNSCASNIGPMCVLSSLKTQRETHMASISYTYMNGYSGTMLWVNYRSPQAGNRSKYTHFGVSGTGCASNISPMCVFSSLKTQQETHMAYTSYIYMNGCSMTMLWVDYRSP